MSGLNCLNARSPKVIRRGLIAGLAGVFILAGIQQAAAAVATTIFKTKKNGRTIVCGLINGKYVPGVGTAARFTSDAAAIAALKKKTDAKSKNKVKTLKAHQKFAAAVCLKGPPIVGNATAGEQVYNVKCSSCHPSSAQFKGMSASQLKSVPGMPALTAQEAADMAAFVK